MEQYPTPNGTDAQATVFVRLAAILAQSGRPHIIHVHAPVRTMAEAAAAQLFDVSRIVKTIAFTLRDGGLVLAALRGTRRVVYPTLAGLLGVGRRDIAPLSPDEVLARLGVAPGSVSPLLAEGRGRLLIDADVLTIEPTLYCGFGRPDRTLEITPGELVAMMEGGMVGEFSKK
jgi:Cys-tRNA(Pro)/Cys-tRNA(Cys) deacylase